MPQNCHVFENLFPEHDGEIWGCDTVDMSRSKTFGHLILKWDDIYGDELD